MTPERARGLAWFVAACAAVAALLLHLLPALLAGLLVFELVHVLAARFNRRTASPRSRLLAAGFIVGLVLVGLSCPLPQDQEARVYRGPFHLAAASPHAGRSFAVQGALRTRPDVTLCCAWRS